MQCGSGIFHFLNGKLWFFIEKKTTIAIDLYFENSKFASKPLVSCIEARQEQACIDLVGDETKDDAMEKNAELSPPGTWSPPPPPGIATK